MYFGELLDKHKETGTECYVATIPVAEREDSDIGIMKTDEKGLISSLIEKPKKALLPDWVSDTGDAMKEKGKVYLASMGIYLFNRELLFEMLETVHKDATDFGKEIIPDSIQHYKIASYQYEGYWTDIGNIYSFFEANLNLTEDLPHFNLF